MIPLKTHLANLADLVTGRTFYCPVCDSRFSRFLTFGVTAPRRNAMCPGCRSLERHRLLWMVLQRLDLLPGSPGQRLLHVAPEGCLAENLAKRYEYVSIDLFDPRATLRMDVTCLEFPDGYFDAIVCNHVLEHVPDDRKALAELHRVLKPGGWASIQVPMDQETTFEDPSVLDPHERERLFGQADHVRSYGRDFLARLQQAGFLVQQVSKSQMLDCKGLRELSVACEDGVWLSRK